MRRALATAALLSGIALGTVATAPAVTAAPLAAGTVVAQDTEPANEDGDDDTGKYGLIGLSGLLGLFGYRKYKDHRAARGQGIGTTDTDGSGSRRV